MQLPDVNVLIYAHRQDAPEHDRYAAWLRALVEAPEPFAVAEIVLAGFLRIVTNPKIFRPATPMQTALVFCRRLVCFRTSQVGRTIGWSVFVLVAPCSFGPARGSAEDFRSVGASHGASPLQLSLVVRISYERGDFCRRVAVDFVRKTVYLRQARKPAHLVRIPHCHGVVARSSRRSRDYFQAFARIQ